MSSPRRLILSALIFLVVFLQACGAGRLLITVGSKDTTEQRVLAEILAQFLEKRFGDQNVARRLALGTTQQAHTAVVAGEIDLCPEYTGAALASLGQPPAAGPSGDARERLQELFRTRFRCEWIGPLGFDNPSVMVVRAGSAVATMPQAEASEEGWSIASTADFQQRGDGLPLLMRQYRLHLTAPLQAMDTAALYASLKDGRVSMIAGSGNDAQLDMNAFQVLGDEKSALPRQEAGIVVRADALERVPGLAAALRDLQGRFNREKIKEMNRQVDIGKQALEVVAATFIKEAGL